MSLELLINRVQLYLEHLLCSEQDKAFSLSVGEKIVRVMWPINDRLQMRTKWKKEIQETTRSFMNDSSRW